MGSLFLLEKSIKILLYFILDLSFLNLKYLIHVNKKIDIDLKIYLELHLKDLVR